jgi:endoglucanase
MKRKNSAISAALVQSLLLLLLVLPSPVGSQQAGWASFKERFLAKEGRIVDDGNNGVSHSEGQGYGLILAEANDDREAFARIWNWTENNLRKRSDHLFAWRWKPAGAGGFVDDSNNATDGDLLVAWGLARAAAAWGNAEFQAAAREIARDIRRKMIRPSRFGPILLPGEHGFEKPEGIVVNLSYWVFPAFRSLAKIDPSSDWPRLEQSGLKLVEAARFSALQLPPDWLLLAKNSLGVANGFEPVYGYNAVRIPLYLLWGGIKASKYYTGFREIGGSLTNGSPPSKVYLPSGKPDSRPALPGMDAIYRLIAGTGDIEPSALTVPYDEGSAGEPYYSMSLGLLSNCAGAEIRK